MAWSLIKLRIHPHGMVLSYTQGQLYLYPTHPYEGMIVGQIQSPIFLTAQGADVSYSLV